MILPVHDGVFFCPKLDSAERWISHGADTTRVHCSSRAVCEMMQADKQLVFVTRRTNMHANEQLLQNHNNSDKQNRAYSVGTAVQQH